MHQRLLRVHSYDDKCSFLFRKEKGIKFSFFSVSTNILRKEINCRKGSRSIIRSVNGTFRDYGNMRAL